MLTLDHIALSAETLDAGEQFISQKLGVELIEGGIHPLFGTHNKLLPLDDVFLEVIAVHPSMAPERLPRWFGLDHFSGQPRITNWVCQTSKARRDIGHSLPGTGDLVNVDNDQGSWRITVAKDGQLPLNGFGPAIVDWGNADHPCQKLKPSGCKLKKLIIRHPHAITLRSFLAGFLFDKRVEIKGSSERASYEVQIETPNNGIVTLY